MSTPRFPLGQLVATPNALEAFARTGDDMHALITRHVSGDWGVVSTNDAEENEFSVTRHLRIFSVYVLSDGTTRVWIITEADRSATTVLLPEDY